jgi:hypothetical protein
VVVRVLAWAGNFPLYHRVQTGSEAYPASCPIGTMSFSLGVKRPGREADHSPPSSAEVKNGAILPLAQFASMVWCSFKIKARDNFIFTLRY